MGWTITKKIDTAWFLAHYSALTQKERPIAFVLVGVDDPLKEHFKTRLYEHFRRTNSAGSNCVTATVHTVGDVGINLPTDLLYKSAERQDREHDGPTVDYLVVDLAGEACCSRNMRTETYRRLRGLGVKEIVCFYFEPQVSAAHPPLESRAIPPEVQQARELAKQELLNNPPNFCEGATLIVV